jgi:hypothetical protein
MSTSGVDRARGIAEFSYEASAYVARSLDSAEENRPPAQQQSLLLLPDNQTRLGTQWEQKSTRLDAFESSSAD